MKETGRWMVAVDWLQAVCWTCVWDLLQWALCLIFPLVPFLLTFLHWIFLFAKTLHECSPKPSQWSDPCWNVLGASSWIAQTNCCWYEDVGVSVETEVHTLGSRWLASQHVKWLRFWLCLLSVSLCFSVEVTSLLNKYTKWKFTKLSRSLLSNKMMFNEKCIYMLNLNLFLHCSNLQSWPGLVNLLVLAVVSVVFTPVESMISEPSLTKCWKETVARTEVIVHSIDWYKMLCTDTKMLWCITKGTKHCFYNWQQLICTSKAQIPEQCPKIPEVLKWRLHGFRAGHIRKFKPSLCSAF